jgi:hypothetical protein
MSFSNRLREIQIERFINPQPEIRNPEGRFTAAFRANYNPAKSISFTVL